MSPFLTIKRKQHTIPMTPVKRKSVLLPFSKVKTMNVIINLRNKTCPLTVDYLDKKAAAQGTSIKYLVINPNRTPIPSCVLRRDMSVLNYEIDYNSAGEIISDTAKSFIDDKCDLLLAVSNEYAQVVENIASYSQAAFKIGRKFTKNNPYDLSLIFKQAEKDDELGYLFLSNLYILTKD